MTPTPGSVYVTNNVDTLSGWMTRSCLLLANVPGLCSCPMSGVVGRAHVSGVGGEIVVVLNRVEQRNAVFVGCQVTLREHVLISDWC